MNKAALIVGLIALLAISSVIAYTPLNYKDRCEIKQAATEYRPERSFGMIGIWGRASNGEPVCFVPGNTPKKEVKPAVVVPEPEPEPDCHTDSVCEWKWVKDWECHWYHGHKVCFWDWDWKKVCHDVEVCVA